MFELANDIYAGLRRHIGLALQARALRRERRRLDRLYGPGDIVPASQTLNASGQTAALSRVVTDYCRRGTDITEAHEVARTKLDAAEYAFTSLLKELSGVLTEVPIGWTPALDLETDRAPPRVAAPRMMAA